MKNFQLKIVKSYFNLKIELHKANLYDMFYKTRCIASALPFVICQYRCRCYGGWMYCMKHDYFLVRLFVSNYVNSFKNNLFII